MENKIEIWNRLIQRDIWLRNKREREVVLASLPQKHTIISSLPIPYKYAGAYALIPSNWDYEKHFAQYPLTNYLFSLKPLMEELNQSIGIEKNKHILIKTG